MKYLYVDKKELIRIFPDEHDFMWMDMYGAALGYADGNVPFKVCGDLSRMAAMRHRYRPLLYRSGGRSAVDDEMDEIAKLLEVAGKGTPLFIAISFFKDF